MPLTVKQKRFLVALDDFYRQHEYPPSHSELAQVLGLKSKGTISDYVKVLNAQGYDSVADYCLRLGAWSEPHGKSFRLLGRVAAGQPIEALLHEEYVDFPSHFYNSSHLDQHFALQVQGDSMKDAGILDGDFILVRKQSWAEHRQVVVASFKGEATLKTLIKKSQHIELHAANSRYAPIIVDDPEAVQIEGVLVGLTRSYSKV